MYLSETSQLATYCQSPLEKSEWCSLAGQLGATVNLQTRLNNGKQHTLPKIPHFDNKSKFHNTGFCLKNGGTIH